MASQGDQGSLCVDCDIVLEGEFRGLGADVKGSKKASIIEKGTPVPCERSGILLKSIHVPVNGEVRVGLYAVGIRRRTIVEIVEGIRWTRWVHYPLGIYNEIQEALGQIPLAGKVIERIAPDAWQTYHLTYLFRMSPDKRLEYKVSLVDTWDPPEEQALCAGEFSL